MKKIIIAIIIAIVIAVPVALYIAANYFFEKQLRYAVQMLGVENTLTWSKSGISLFGRSGYISGVKFGDITADRITFSRYSYQRTLTVQVDNLIVPVTPALGKLYDPAYLMGYNSFHIQSTINCVLSGNILELSSDNINIVEIGRPSLFLSFNDITTDRIIPAITSVIKEDKTIDTMRLTLDNSGDAIARAVNALAVVTNSDYDQAKARLMDALSRYATNGVESGKQNLLQLYRLVESPAAVAIQLTNPIKAKELMPTDLSMSNIEAWRATGQRILALPISVSAY